MWSKGFRKAEIAHWASLHLQPGSHVVSDGIAYFDAVHEAGCEHQSIISGGGRAAVENLEFNWVNTVLGNLTSALRNSYHSFEPKYAQRYLVEFEYRFNRRYRLQELIPTTGMGCIENPTHGEETLEIWLILSGN